MINAHNVRTIGKKITISILKKPNIGLGFTIVTRDNQVLYGSGADLANSIVILVNKILKNGGAADDGRLKPGDRILEVNSVPVTSLKDATDKLRSIPENTSVELLISRVEKDEVNIFSIYISIMFIIINYWGCMANYCRGDMCCYATLNCTFWKI